MQDKKEKERKKIGKIETVRNIALVTAVELRYHEVAPETKIYLLSDDSKNSSHKEAS